MLPGSAPSRFHDMRLYLISWLSLNGESQVSVDNPLQFDEACGLNFPPNH